MEVCTFSQENIDWFEETNTFRLAYMERVSGWMFPCMCNSIMVKVIGLISHYHYSKNQLKHKGGWINYKVRAFGIPKASLWLKQYAHKIFWVNSLWVGHLQFQIWAESAKPFPRWYTSYLLAGKIINLCISSGQWCHKQFDSPEYKFKKSSQHFYGFSPYCVILSLTIKVRQVANKINK